MTTEVSYELCCSATSTPDDWSRKNINKILHITQVFTKGPCMENSIYYNKVNFMRENNYKLKVLIIWFWVVFFF